MRQGLRLSMLLALFWLVGLSLGYPTVNRYQPGPPSLADATYYAEMVEVGIPNMRDVGHWRYRVLVPALARPVYLLAQNRVGQGDPRFVALLVVNAGFCAVTALVLYVMGAGLLDGPRHGLMAAFLFLVNFNTSNLYLSGLVDSAEICLIALVMWSLWRDRWLALPFLGLAGGAAKETFIGFAGMLAGGWWLAGWPAKGLRWHQLAAVAGMGLGSLGMVIFLWSTLSGHLVLPAGVAGSYFADRSLGERLSDLPAYATRRAFWYTFAWLLPLAALGARRLPREFWWSAAPALGGALFMSGWANAGDNIGRPLFAAVGLILTLAAAAGLARLTENGDAR